MGTPRKPIRIIKDGENTILQSEIGIDFVKDMNVYKIMFLKLNK